MNKLLGIITVAAVALWAGGQTGRADRVRMRSGKVVEGILSQTPPTAGGADKIRLWIGPAQIALPAEQVDSVTTDTAAENLLIDARYQFEGRRHEEGAQKLGLAVQQGIAPAKVIEILNQYGDRLAESIPQMTQSGREGVSQALIALQTVPAAQGPELAARRLFLHVALGEAGQGEAILNAMGPQYFASHPAEAARLSAALNGLLDAWAVAEDFASGQTAIQMLQRLDPRRAGDTAAEFYLRWGSFERRSGRYESALRIYSRSLMTLAPDVARQLIQTTLKAAEEAARPKNQLLEITGLYETYAMRTDPAFATAGLARIWHDEGLAHLWDNKFAAAREAFEKAEQYQKGVAAKELLQCEWRERRARLGKDDFKGHYELAQWCLDKEIYEPALTELREAQGSPELAAEASAKAESVRSKLAEARLAEIMALYEGGNYSKVVTEAVPRFMREEHPAGYLAQAKQIRDMAEEALRMNVALRPQQAESLYRQAERAYYEEDYRRAKAMVETITGHYADTVTYPRASALGALVDQRLAIAALENGRKPATAAGRTSSTLARLNQTSLTTGTTTRLVNTIDRPTTAATTGLINTIDQPTSGTRGHIGNAPVQLRAPVPAPAPTPPAPVKTPPPAAPADSTARRPLDNALRQLIGDND